MEDPYLLYYLAGVPLLGIAAQWLAWRLRIPSILLLLGFGVVLGLFVRPDALIIELLNVEGADAADEVVGPRLLLPIVSLSVAVILFEGGLSLRLSELKQAGGVVLRLVTIGAAVSWIASALAAWKIAGLDLRLAALLGAVLVVTGPTVVAPLLRQIRPTRRVGSILKWEGIVIDPIGAVLAVLVFEQVFAAGGEHFSLLSMLMLLGKTALIGVGFGVVVAGCLVAMVKRYWIPDFLHGVVFLTTALAAFAVSNWLQEESGLVTVTVLGILLANQKQVPIGHVVEFKEHLGVLLISCLFIVLGSRLDPARIVDLGMGGFLFLVVLIVVVRPLSVLLATLGAAVNWREKLFLAFLAPRGIVAAAVVSVFSLKVAAYSSDAALAAQATALVPMTFLVIVGTVAVYGLSAGPLARWLNLADPNPQGVLIAGAAPWILKVSKALLDEGFQVLLIDTNYRLISAARQLGVAGECGSILSEQMRDELNLGGLGRLLALTPNDEVNALATREFAHVFGRANVYQLAPWDVASGKRASIGEHLRGRILFRSDLHHDEFASRLAGRFAVKTTPLTEEFTFDDFQQMYGEAAIVLFVIDENKNLNICTAEKPPAPQPGQRVVAIVEPQGEKQLAAERAGAGAEPQI